MTKKTIRKSSGRFQFIFDFGFNKEDFGLGLTACYLDPWEMEDMQMLGFWSIAIELLFIEITMHITDKRFKRENMRYRSGVESDLIKP